MNAPDLRASSLAAPPGALRQPVSLQGPSSRDALTALWLEWLVDLLPDVGSAVVLLDDGANALVPSAARPAGSVPPLLRALVERAVKERGIAVKGSSQGCGMAFPMLVSNRVVGVVALEVVTDDPPSLAYVSKTVQWGMGWLRGSLGQQPGARQQMQFTRARLAIDQALTVLAQRDFARAAMALCSRLAKPFGATQVLLGWVKRGEIRLVSRSNSAWHDTNANLVGLAEQAMNEALDQDMPLLLPALEGPRLTATLAVDAYRRISNARAVMVIPLLSSGVGVGALLFERDTPFTQADIDAAEAMALIISPLLALQHAAHQGVLVHLGRRFREVASSLFGSRYLGWKLVGSVAAAALCFAALMPVAHRVTAPSMIEGATMRACVAPFSGFIRSASYRAGDVVRGGQVLARLDDKDLELERVRWEADLEVAIRKEREAFAVADRVALGLARAQADQARAQLALVNEKLSRLDIRAPYDALVVRGDLSQMLGSPVEPGKVLFELAPLEAYRVILKVDERDVAWVKPGHRGELVLTSLPGAALQVDVQRVLSVAVAEEGRNFFRVEAAVAAADIPNLRPGMEGVAKVGVGSASLLWVWTHGLVDWLRRTAWEWAP